MYLGLFKNSSGAWAGCLLNDDESAMQAVAVWRRMWGVEPGSMCRHQPSE